jgi:hypothetical protein
LSLISLHQVLSVFDIWLVSKVSIAVLLVSLGVFALNVYSFGWVIDPKLKGVPSAFFAPLRETDFSFRSVNFFSGLC